MELYHYNFHQQEKYRCAQAQRQNNAVIAKLSDKTAQQNEISKNLIKELKNEINHLKKMNFFYANTSNWDSETIERLTKQNNRMSTELRKKNLDIKRL